MRSPALTLVAGSGLVVPAYLGLFLTGTPTLFCPLPFLTVTPAFVLSSLLTGQFTRAAVLVPSLLFFAWNPGLFRGQVRVPKRSLVLLVVATLFSVAWFTGGWKYGLEYQGRQYTYIICIMDGAWLAALWAILVACWRRTSFAGNLLFHWLLFAWLGWYAFPYLGELP
ncbi:MAG: hypothetical protein WBQ85_20045 [Candidatus Sulfotelmatobacter sp.]